MPATMTNEIATSLGWNQPAPPQQRRRHHPIQLTSFLPTEPVKENLTQLPSNDQYRLPEKQPTQENSFIESPTPGSIGDFLQKLIYGSRSHYSSRRNSPVRSLISESQLGDLRKHFELRDEASVRAYLCKYPFLLTLLLEAKAQVTRIFGEETKPALEVSVDPNDWAAQLFIVIPTRLNADEISLLFDQLDQEWWMEASERANYRLNFIPEFN